MSRFLQWSFDGQDAASSSAAGWQPSGPTGPRETQDELAEPAWADEPRFCAAVRRHVDRWPGYLQALVPAAISELPLLERICVEALIRDQVDPRDLQRHWPELVRLADRYRPLSTIQGIDRLMWWGTTSWWSPPRTPQVHARAGLEYIARACWDDTGAPRYEAWGAASLWSASDGGTTPADAAGRSAA